MIVGVYVQQQQEFLH